MAWYGRCQSDGSPLSPPRRARRGLLLAATLADQWGFYRTTAGKAVYFTLP